MNELIHPFRKYCHTIFGKEKGDTVYRFYRDFFSSRYRKDGVEKSYSDEDKKRNIEYILSKNDKNALFSCIQKFIGDFEKGVVKTHSLKYFTKAAENFTYTPQENKTISIQGTLEKGIKIDQNTERKEMIVVPIPLKKIRDSYEDMLYNYDYICSCKEIIDPWTTICPKCKSVFSWRDIDITQLS